MLLAMVRALGHEMLDNRQKYKPGYHIQQMRSAFLLLTYYKGKAIPHHSL